ncbi:hypothetical protein C352_02788, partial [Cryptococcus neoformans CHC193]
ALIFTLLDRTVFTPSLPSFSSCFSIQVHPCNPCLSRNPNSQNLLASSSPSRSINVPLKAGGSPAGPSKGSFANAGKTNQLSKLRTVSSETDPAATTM